jgi:hypothetical protein|tara:strand:- start:397 stop:573 length:177 start_codon:yes stop_codon:yes gene_type:complete
MIKQLPIFKDLKDNLLRWIEIKAGQVHEWAWDKRLKKQDPNKWVKGYREFKKRKCPHN